MMNRKEYIDSLRGIAILLVVIGHFFNKDFPVKVFYIFHVPLFFVISGFLMSGGIPVKSFLKKRFEGIILPYFLLGIPVVISTALFSEESFGVICYEYLIQKRFTTMWFLPTLFWAQLFYLLICKGFAGHTGQKASEYGPLACSAAAAALGLVYQKRVGVLLPWNLDLGLICTVFVASGNFYKRRQIQTNHTAMKGTALLLLGLFLGGGRC